MIICKHHSVSGPTAASTVTNTLFLSLIQEGEVQCLTHNKLLNRKHSYTCISNKPVSTSLCTGYTGQTQRNFSVPQVKIKTNLIKSLKLSESEFTFIKT